MKSRKTKIIILIAVLTLLLSAVFGTLLVSAILSGGDEGKTFDGLDEYKTAQDPIEMPLPLTYEATVYFPTYYVGEGGVIFGNYSGDSTAGFKLEINESGAPRLYIIDAGTVKYDVIFSSVNLFCGTKAHLAITLDVAAGSATCYVNGEAAETLTVTLPAQFNLTSIFALGGDNVAGNPQYFKGELFGVSLYSDTRSAAEIAADAAGGDIDTSELIAAYAPLGPEKESITAMGDTKYNLTYTCEWIKDLPAPEDYAYSFAVIGDIQSMTYYYPDKLVEQFEWIRDNAEERKIAFSVGLGDITETNTDAEYLKVIEAYGKIDGVIPFSIIRGNHERTTSNDTTMYDTYITQERYGDEITGSYDDTMHNTYRIIQIGKVKYMFMNLDLVLSDGAIEWANEIIAAHPECHVIVSTHAYKNMGGSYLKLATDGKFGVENDSVVLWDNLLSQHENIVMVLYGHSPKDTIWKKQRNDTVNGNTVTEMLINPSELDKVYGGGGYVAMFYFSEDGTQLDVQYYSTGKGAYFKSQNQFSLTLDTPGTIEFSSVIMNVGSDETERNLTWYTQYDTTGEVRYGKSTDGTLPESYSTVPAVAVKAAKLGYYSYKATLTGLEENSTYVYQLVTGDIASECYTFNTYSMGDDFAFAFVTDPQVKKSSHATLWDDTLNKIKNDFNGVSFVVSAGDQTSDPASEDNFDWFISKHLSSLAISTTVGPPHDNTQLYKDHYNLPNLSTTYGISTPSSDYSYTYNNVLFMHLNVENHDHEGHIQFVENTIRDNPDALWRVVVLHYSFFSGGNHSTDSSVIAFREACAGRFNELGIDLVLSGHDHVYTRSQMMTDGYTVSGDVVTNGTVTDPTGTLYICGTSSTGSGYYNVEHHDDDAYIAFTEDTNRKGIVIFSVSEGSLTLKSYFIDGTSPELFDSFTINKTKKTVRLNGDTDMLEITDGTGRIPLVNAYAYSFATVKVVDGYWSVSTDGGESFTSLGVASSDTLNVLRINEETGCWELSNDGGTSFESLGINARTYTVKYVALPGATFGDSTDLSLFSTRRFTAATPDAPALYMPKGSLGIGELYDWTWEYYLLGGDGTPVTTFAFGESYVAYPTSSATPIASTIYIDTVSSPEEYTYTWAEAWDIVLRCAGEKLTLVLKSDLTLTAGDAISVVVPVDLTLDLGGKRLNTSALAPAVKLAVGSNGSCFTVVTSAEGGVLYAGSNDFIEIGSNQGSSVTVRYGSSTTKPLTVESARYLVGANGNFKYASTLTLDVYGGSYTVTRGVIYVSNVSANQTANIYKLTLTDAEFNFAGGDSAIVRAKSTTGFYAGDTSYINATGCTFTDTYKANHTSSRYLIREDCWYGTASFTDCDLVGMSIGADVAGAALTTPAGITIGGRCTFTNSETTFKAANPLSFFSEKVALASGYVIARTDALGSAEVLPLSGVAKITWHSPVGYTEYWKLGVVPSYLGEASFTSGDVTYSLVLSETPVAANADKTYTFVSAEGYLYRYDSANSVWQISTDGGNTYTNIGEAEITPDPEPTIGCTLTVDGIDTTFTADTDFYSVLQTVNTSSYAGKVIKITLGADMSFRTKPTYNRAATLEIDLAGHKLTYEADGRFQVGATKLHIYSSVAGGEFAFGSGDGLQPSSGAIVFGSEEYKNNLTVSTTNEILNPAQVANGKTLHFEFLYCTVNASTSNLLRINAKGAGVITLEMVIKGCTVNGDKSVICYNYSSTLGATSNGGVCSTASYINVTDSSFTCTADAPVDFFGSPNFADRYFGTVSFAGTTFNNYVLNGDLLYSDEVLVDGDGVAYNTYYSTLTGYDPTKAITVGEGCKFYNYGTTFTADMQDFSASNASLAADCMIAVASDHVEIISSNYGCAVTLDGITTYYSKSADLKDVLGAFNTADYSNKEITLILNADMSFGGTVNFSKASNYTLNIDLAGHKLTVNAGGRIRFGGSFTLNIYSSVVGGEVIFATSSDCIQLDSTGSMVFGSEDYKNNLTVSAVADLLNVSQLADGSSLEIKYLYSTINAGSNGLVRLNAKGAGAVTLEAEITGCTVNGSSKIVCYNTSSTLGATSNGGVYTTESYIRATDSSFTSTADAPAGFFGSGNFSDRYFGTVSFTGCTFNNYVLNGELIYSDEPLSYNTYYDTLTDYDPAKAITVGKDCVFYNCGDTFTEDMSSFAAKNTSVAGGCIIAYTDSSVMILDSAEHVLSDWMSEDGQHWKVCTSCSDELKLNLADCNVVESVCTVCGASYAPVDPSPEHSYESVVTPPTCTEGGYTTNTCSHCGDTYVDGYVAATGHSYGDWAVTTTPTCTEAGTRVKECSACHATKSESIDALGHDELEHEAKAPTCSEVGWGEYVTCRECDYTTYSEIPALGHSWADAACEVPKTCTACGATEGAALGHSWTDAACEAPKTCTACSATEGTALGHRWSDATTEAPKTCSVCGKTEGEKLPADDGKDNVGEEDKDDVVIDSPCVMPDDDHSDCEASGWDRFWNAIINFFRTLFGMPKLCVCGKEI